MRVSTLKQKFGNANILVIFNRTFSTIPALLPPLIFNTKTHKSMKSSKLAFSLLSVGLTIFLTSCGSGGNEKTAAADTAAAAPAAVDSAAKPKPVSTIVTTPQNMVIVIHKVANFAKWMTAYEADDANRLAAGLHSYVVGRGKMDSNMVLIAMKMDDTAKGKAFGNSPGLK